VFFVKQEAIDEGIPAELRGAPFIVDEAGQFDERLNEYLWARRNGDWASGAQVQGRYVEAQGRDVLRAKLNYLRERAYQINILRRWLAKEALDYRDVDEAILDLYGDDLEDGLAEGVPGIQPSSVNVYLLSAIDFLNFGARRGWRKPLVLSRSSKGGRSQRSKGRPEESPLLVMRRASPAELDVWYSEEEIEAYIGEFETAPAALAARIIHRLGLRLAEVLDLKVGSFPTLEEFREDRARRSIFVVGKFGKRRRVPLDETIVKAIDQFKSLDRKVYAKRLKTAEDTLLIADSLNGKTAPLLARNLQKQFAQARRAAGFSRLSPHLLRHHFAAHFLLREWRKKARILSVNPSAFDVISGKSILSSELLRLQKALGHKSFDTTAGYLHGVSYLIGSSLPAHYSDELDGEAS
jgi:integrase